MSTYKTTRITISDILRGYIWMPNTECTKNVSEEYAHESAPFRLEWDGLRDALVRLTNDGDFRSCALDECWLTVTRTNALGARRVRTWNVRPEGENADCFNPEAAHV